MTGNLITREIIARRPEDGIIPPATLPLTFGAALIATIGDAAAVTL